MPCHEEIYSEHTSHSEPDILGLVNLAHSCWVGSGVSLLGPISVSALARRRVVTRTWASDWSMRLESGLWLVEREQTEVTQYHRALDTKTFYYGMKILGAKKDMKYIFGQIVLVVGAWEWMCRGLRLIDSIFSLDKKCQHHRRDKTCKYPHSKKNW